MRRDPRVRRPERLPFCGCCAGCWRTAIRRTFLRADRSIRARRSFVGSWPRRSCACIRLPRSLVGSWSRRSCPCASALWSSTLRASTLRASTLRASTLRASTLRASAPRAADGAAHAAIGDHSPLF